jgi:hypothetical protein
MAAPTLIASAEDSPTKTEKTAKINATTKQHVFFIPLSL